MIAKDDVIEELFSRAKTSLSAGHSAVAAELLSVYVALRPAHNYALFLLGDSLRELGRAEEAERLLLQALSAASSNSRAETMARLGMLKADHGALSDGERWFRLATEDDYGGAKGWIWVMRGSNLAVAGRFEEAAACHERATQLLGDRDEAFLNLGYVRRAQGRYAEAVDAFRKALEITPDFPKAKTALEGLADIFQALEFAASVRSEAPAEQAEASGLNGPESRTERTELNSNDINGGCSPTS